MANTTQDRTSLAGRVVKMLRGLGRSRQRRHQMPRWAVNHVR